MENLVLCPCGHSLTLHDFTGCAGDRLRRCECPLDRHGALDAAVDQARSAAPYRPTYAGRRDDAA